LCGRVIVAAADQQAVTFAGKLFKPASLGVLIAETLYNAGDRGNPFDLVYRALEMRDPELEKAVIAWCERTLEDPALNIPKDRRHQWAESLAARYGSAPTPAQWAKDPLASRLKISSRESFQAEVVRLAGEASQKRTRE
jgi:hypothetical protein